MTKLYQQFASALQAYNNCVAADYERLDAVGDSWDAKHEERLQYLCAEYMPSGSGFDAGTTFDINKSKPDRLVFCTSFHHMNEHGSYCRWTEHDVIVTPSLAFGFNLRATGRDYNEIKDYIGETFGHALNMDI